MISTEGFAGRFNLNHENRSAMIAFVKITIGSPKTRMENKPALSFPYQEANPLSALEPNHSKEGMRLRSRKIPVQPKFNAIKSQIRIDGL
jgi:hypothetical protein